MVEFEVAACKRIFSLCNNWYAIDIWIEKHTDIMLYIYNMCTWDETDSHLD